MKIERISAFCYTTTTKNSMTLDNKILLDHLDVELFYGDMNV